MTKDKALAIVLRAAVTAVEVFLAAVITTGLSNLDAEGAQVALMSAAGAGLSILYNGVRVWLDSLQGVDPLPNG
jgi:hypothetical protein